MIENSRDFTEGKLPSPVDWSKKDLGLGLDRKQVMVSTPIIGACTVCHISGSVDLPADFNPSVGDQLLEGRISKVWCPKCRKTQEFRPLTPKELREDQFYVFKRYYAIYKKNVTDGLPVPPIIRQLIDAYEALLARKGLSPPKHEKPPAPQAPRIIQPGEE